MRGIEVGVDHNALLLVLGKGSSDYRERIVAGRHQLEQVDSRVVGDCPLRIVGVNIGEGDSRAWYDRTIGIGNLTGQAAACALSVDKRTRARQADEDREQ